MLDFLMRTLLTIFFLRKIYFASEKLFLVLLKKMYAECLSAI